MKHIRYQNTGGIKINLTRINTECRNEIPEQKSDNQGKNLCRVTPKVEDNLIVTGKLDRFTSKDDDDLQLFEVKIYAVSP